MVCFINSAFSPLADAKLPVNDLGLQRGYGIFDFLRVTDHIPLFIDDHLERFYRSADLMRLSIPYDTKALKEIIAKLLQKNNLSHAGVKILLTGGASKDGYSIGEPNLVIIQQPLVPPPDAILQPGYRLVTYQHRRQMPEVKTTDYMLAIHLQPWLKEKGGDDLLYCQNGMISECPRSNFFIVTQDNRLVTPGQHVLKGITRKQLLTIASNIGMVVEERDVAVEELKLVKEAFITSSTKRLIPVRQVDDLVLPGFSETSVTARLYRAFKEWELSTIHGRR